MLKVLIVDDDFMIADSLEDILADAGYDVCRIARCLAETVAIDREHRPDLAIIDRRSDNGEYGTDVAEALRRDAAMGVLYATANPDRKLLKNGTDEGCIAKPYTPSTILAALLLVRERLLNLPVLSPLPQRFRLLGG